MDENKNIDPQSERGIKNTIITESFDTYENENDNELHFYFGEEKYDENGEISCYFFRYEPDNGKVEIDNYLDDGMSWVYYVMSEPDYLFDNDTNMITITMKEDCPKALIDEAFSAFSACGKIYSLSSDDDNRQWSFSLDRVEPESE